jgi:hypothetical protein
MYVAVWRAGQDAPVPDLQGICSTNVWCRTLGLFVTIGLPEQAETKVEGGDARNLIANFALLG